MCARVIVHSAQYAAHLFSSHALYLCAACCVAGAVPQLVTAWQGVSRAETQKAFDDAAAAYAQRFTPDLDGSGSAVEEQQLYEQHQVGLYPSG
jgi:hypothetical protein